MWYERRPSSSLSVGDSLWLQGVCRPYIWTVGLAALIYSYSTTTMTITSVCHQLDVDTCVPSPVISISYQCVALCCSTTTKTTKICVSPDGCPDASLFPVFPPFSPLPSLCLPSLSVCFDSSVMGLVVAPDYMFSASARTAGCI